MTHDNPGLTLIRVARLIDGNGGPPLERAAIHIQGDRIAAVGTEESVFPPEGAEVEEYYYERGTALPGLVDCHVHLIGIGDGRMGDDLNLLPDEVLTLQAARNARTHLYSGVTTVRDCGAKNRTTFMLREASIMGITPTPRLLLCGRPIAIIGGHMSYFGTEATGEDECRTAVRQLIKEGADYIKVTATGGSTRTSYPLRASFTVEELRAICEEAHKFGKHVAAHCSSSPGIATALEAGVDTLVHTYYKEPDGTFNYRPDLTEEIARQGIFVNPTLHQGRRRACSLEEKQQSEGLTVKEQEELDGFRAVHETLLDFVSRMRSEGVRLVCGSDSAWSYYPMGEFQDEIDAHVAVGMSPMEAIVSATGDSARSCWADDRLGTLDPGKCADVLVVEGNPSQDISALKNVLEVFKDGRAVDRANLV